MIEPVAVPHSEGSIEVKKLTSNGGPTRLNGPANVAPEHPLESSILISL